MADGDHDGFFKDVFRRPAEAAGLLRATLPEGLVTALDWGRLELLTGETEASSGGGHRRDLVFRVPFRKGAHRAGGGESGREALGAADGFRELAPHDRSGGMAR